MYLSCLLIDVGDNPDRPRPGRLWLRNLYHVHQRLCMAFPSDDRKKRDPDFLAPYAPGDFPEQRHLADKKKGEVCECVLRQVHAPRQSDSGFLFRVEPQPGGRGVILVQSAVEPHWDYAFHNAGYLLAAPHQTKEFDPRFEEGERLQFRLLVNPTKRVPGNHVVRADGKWKDGPRVPVRPEGLFKWLSDRGELSGFAVSEDGVTVQTGYVYFDKKTREGERPQGGRLRSVRFDGVLTVTDPEKLRETIMKGIGSGKAFGFGLLSVAPVR